MGIQTFFNSDGTALTAVITIIGSDGNHVDPDSWPITNDPAIVLSSHPSASKTVTAIDTGVFKVVWTGLSAALSHGDVVHISIDGAIGGTAWSTWVVPIQVVLLPTVQGETVNANAIQISGDSTAADNLEAALDGTGGVTITAGLTGNVTGNLSGSIGSLGTQAKLDVNTECDTAISDAALATAAALAATDAKIDDILVDTSTTIPGYFTTRIGIGVV